ncbi:response regulator [Porphyrobacter algicida]|uniref:Response regulator n=1 Tax=Qipengyuania algicida TaxID=1836209 RepID=A0A845AH42_9SPHN|nr:response regulator [Qipengyuania algicida]MXP29560.1 response regulator [Qipengyuania algicida]
MRILLVDDLPELAQALSLALRDFGLSCDIVGCAQNAGLILGQSDYAMVVLDLGLPDEVGLTSLRTWRACSTMNPVIVLIARTDVDMLIMALRTGAEDYLAKSFDVEELHARMEAVLRRISVYFRAMTRYRHIRRDVRPQAWDAVREQLDRCRRQLRAIVTAGWRVSEEGGHPLVKEEVAAEKEALARMLPRAHRLLVLLHEQLDLPVFLEQYLALFRVIESGLGGMEHAEWDPDRR